MTGERIWLYDTTLRDGAQTQGVDFSVQDKLRIARELDALGIDYVEGGWPGANPTDDAFFASPPELKRARLCAFGMTRRSGRSAANDPGLVALFQAKTPVITLVGKSSARQAEGALGRQPGREPDHDRGFGPRGRPARRGGDARRRAFLRRLQGGCRVHAGLPAGGARSGCPLDRALRHQWRRPAARGRGGGRPGGAAHPGRAAGHPHPQRHRERRRQQPGRHPGRRAAGAGHAQRPGRALRQRQSGEPDPDPEAQAGLRGRGQRRRPAPPDPALAHLRRAAEPHAQPARRLCRRLGLRPQGGPARLGRGQEPGLLRAHRPGPGRQCARRPGLGPGRPGQPDVPLRRDGPRRRPRPGADGRAPGADQGPRGQGLGL